MTGSDVVIYSTSIPGGTMGAGKCLSATIWHLTNAAGTATDYKLTYGATSYTLLAANAGVGVSTYWFLRLCNNVGVTNAQTLYDPYIAYNVGPLGVFVSASGMAPVTGTFAVDSTATQTLAFKANSAGSTVKGYEWRVTVDR
jgi:hypothetical protein